MIQEMKDYEEFKVVTSEKNKTKKNNVMDG